MKTLKKQFGSGRKKLNTLRQTGRNSHRNVRSFSVLSIEGKNRISSKKGNIEDTIIKGRYLATNPKSAASKAFSKWCKHNGKNEKCTATVTIYETTAGNPHKKYSYNALRRAHQTKAVYKGKTRSGDVEIEHKYVNQLYTTKNVKSLSSRSPKN